ncbi:hypothetical protein J2X68_007710 [Streptomyces sp. 3330]|uniref:hypothetical protein n=1 Tax=Streptomyces sp. 3330 TaxID=2817755 RepID=UPI002856BE44|nr:hypothetical protein [Streptomyces sp. 3330]MDR6980968.1 hypothetical protein [Streptomyces sp. 3330]
MYGASEAGGLEGQPDPFVAAKALPQGSVACTATGCSAPLELKGRSRSTVLLAVGVSTFMLLVNDTRKDEEQFDK